jgi:hypothetical protein
LLAVNRRNIIWVIRDIVACWLRFWIDIDNVPIVHLKACRVNHFNRLVHLGASVLKDHRNRLVNESRPDNDLAPARLPLYAFAVDLFLAYANDDIFWPAPERKKRTSFPFNAGRSCGNVLHPFRAAKILR